MRPLDVLAGPGNVVGRRGRRALTVDARSFASDRRRIQKPARHRSRSENENFAQTHADTKKFQVSRQDPKCPEVKLGIPKPTSGHQQVTRPRCPEVGLGIFDPISERSRKVKSRKCKPTSGHQEHPAKVADRKKRRRQNEGANNVIEHSESMQNSLVFLRFEAHRDIRGDFNTYDR